jgi:hypothetical protein
LFVWTRQPLLNSIARLYPEEAASLPKSASSLPEESICLADLEPVKLEIFVGGLGSPAFQITVPSSITLNIPKFDDGQLMLISSIMMGEPDSLSTVHSAIVLLVLKLLIFISGHTSIVGVGLGVDEGVLDGVSVIVGV